MLQKIRKMSNQSINEQVACNRKREQDYVLNVKTEKSMYIKTN